MSVSLRTRPSKDDRRDGSWFDRLTTSVSRHIARKRPVSRNRDSSHKSRAGHPSSTPTRLPRRGPRGWRRCSSLTYSRYARSSRLAIRAPRSGTYATNHCYGTLNPNSFEVELHRAREWDHADQFPMARAKRVQLVLRERRVAFDVLAEHLVFPS